MRSARDRFAPFPSKHLNAHLVRTNNFRFRVAPPAQGLYDPRFERDACGVGFVCDIRGRPSTRVLRMALEMLESMKHRGACGCEPDSGDGAGIMVNLPDRFIRGECARLRISLPPAGQYAVGMVFLPTDVAARYACEKLFEKVVADYGMVTLGWRDVPVRNRCLGHTPRLCEPKIRQVFVGMGERFFNRQDFERRLYLVRQLAENSIEFGDLGKAAADDFYICILSTNRLVYKGMLTATQLREYFPDLHDPDFETSMAIIHSRFSTNTFPSWRLAHPYRYLAHNGEINALRGNRNWMRARYASLASEDFGDELSKMVPILTETGSDSATLDNALQFLVVNGRSLAHSVLMLIPEAWQGNDLMDPDLRAFYEYHACLMEPWDGPAAIVFTDGHRVGAVLDRNGLRPARYCVTEDGLVVMASEVGTIPLPAERIARKWRLQPGRIFMVDTDEGRIVEDSEIKAALLDRRPWKRWIEKNMVVLEDLPPSAAPPRSEPSALLERQRAFGYTIEELKLVLAPMAVNAEEAIGSMGADTPLACLSDRPQLLFNYFKQLFAQVTNPPLDAIRESLVTSLVTWLGREGNLLTEEPSHCRLLRLKQPILTNPDLEKIRALDQGAFRARTLSMLFAADEGEEGLHRALDALCREAAGAVRDGATLLILSDRGVTREKAPIPSLLACAAVHHHLIREGTRTQAGLILETGEAREAHHFCLLIGYGAGAVNPWLALESLADLHRAGTLPLELSAEQAVENFIKAANKAILKVASKMGISTVQSYRGAQIFEAVGLAKELVDRWFVGTASRLDGLGLDLLARETLLRHRRAFPPVPVDAGALDAGGFYKWNREGDHHMWNPESVALVRHAVRVDSYATFQQHTKLANDESRRRCTIRGLLEFREGAPIPIAEVEPAKEIVKRFATGAMSFGSISREAHETLAIAMNRLGGKSNTGEGGEDPARFRPDANGDLRRSAIKQVASARFGVTAEYLVNAEELQIKMAQGAKPGEGGQLPGHKVDDVIAKVRHSTPGVGLISPPPHHDIYSIEDLAQLIHDLKNVNPAARVSVKLVSEIGVGTVAAGVAKAKADHILISGDSGGTGASPLTSIKHAGLPWELGLAEAQQTLVLNRLRGRVVLQTDGQIKTGRDVAIAALLGAEEIGFATGALIAIGCVMMRVCHLNTCPVGIATQDPELRARFAGAPEYVVRFMFYIAEEVREIMARLGFRKFEEMVGRSDLLRVADLSGHWKARHLDLSAILHRPNVPAETPLHGTERQDHGLEYALDHELILLAKGALDRGDTVRAELPIKNVNRTVGAMLSGLVARRHGHDGLPDGTIHFKFSGSAGQSFGAFLARGITLELEGEANDYLGKGLSGGRLVAYPPRIAKFRPEENILAGNAIAYGATSGEIFLRGVVGERFGVRNSGAHAVVEGVGDHGCEYMTGGRVVVLGPTGRNFAAGMSGGIAWVYDPRGLFKLRCNPGMVSLEPADRTDDRAELRALVERHATLTESSLAKDLLARWEAVLPKFVRVMPHDYRRVLERRVEIAARTGAPSAL
ncbi:MAG: glutamate synthase large subunit [Verrucomicrobiae bacterium]|nr:glutamate synthase large subunit [Verrucomicrobiae bacterium]